MPYRHIPYFSRRAAPPVLAVSGNRLHKSFLPGDRGFESLPLRDQKVTKTLNPSNSATCTTQTESKIGVQIEGRENGSYAERQRFFPGADRGAARAFGPLAAALYGQEEPHQGIGNRQRA